MTMRRANGSGAICRLKGNRRKPYAVRVSYPHPTNEGKYKQRYLAYFHTSAEAQAYLEKLNCGQIKAGGYTLGDVWEDYTRSRRFTELSKSAQNVHRGAWNRLSALADRPIDAIRRPELQRVIDDALEGGLAPSSAEKIKILMGLLFKRALMDDLISKDPTLGLELPKIKPVVEKDVIPQPVVAQLWTRKDEPYVQITLVLIYTGWRISELLELTPEAYHTEPVPHLIGGKKTDAGINRPVPVHPAIQPFVESRASSCKERIFEDVGSYTVVLDRFKKILRQYGVEKATPHWCRYTLTSMLEMAGANRLATDRITGHSDRGMTDHYTKMTVEYLYSQMCLIRV